MSRAKKNISVIVGLLAFLGLSCQTQEDVEEEVRRAPSWGCVEVSAAQICRVYEENELAADASYENRIFCVYGTIEDIGKDILDQIYITLKGERMIDVQCFFSNAHMSKIASLRKGQTTKVKGKCKGLSLGSVLFEGCVLE